LPVVCLKFPCNFVRGFFVELCLIYLPPLPVFSSLPLRLLHIPVFLTGSLHHIFEKKQINRQDLFIFQIQVLGNAA
jgi:hypothetical protein